MVRQAKTPPQRIGSHPPAPAAPEAVGAVLDRTIPGPDGAVLAVRVYEPRTVDPAAGSSPAPARRRPALVYFLGQDATHGYPEAGDCVCRALTNAAYCVTVAVRHRCAPAAPFPDVVEDCHAAMGWVAGHAAELGIDPARIAVGGHGPGGALAAAVALRARDTGPTLRHQLLLCPQAEPAAGGAETPSLAGLPETTLVTAELDPLREQAEQHALMLLASGVAVDVRRYPGVSQGFFTRPAVYRGAREAQSYAAARLAAAFAQAESGA